MLEDGFELLDLFVEVVECFFETLPLCFLLQAGFEPIDLPVVIFTHGEDICFECLHFGDQFGHFLFLGSGVLFCFLAVLHFIVVFAVCAFLGGASYGGVGGRDILFGVVIGLDVRVEFFDVLLHVDYLVLGFEMLLV